MKKLPYKSATGPEIAYHDCLQPFTVKSGNLHRDMMPGNVYPGEEGRAAEVAKGNDPPHSPQYKTVLRTAQGEAWLAFQLLQKSTRTPPLEPNY
eukprot:6882638-Pyramimonas_sp.AAC.1